MPARPPSGRSGPSAEATHGEARLSIGALSRATAIPIDTLRTWERRYGFPVPERKPSGHRVYAVTSVPRLRRIAEALSMGHRAAEVVAASDQELAALLESNPAHHLPMADAVVEEAGAVDDLLRAVRDFDADRLTHRLALDALRLPPVPFLVSRIVPLMREVGHAWARGELEIRHEHFLSERIGDLLRSLRLPYEERAAGPLIVFATLPGEAHALGLQMAAMTVASAGCRVLYLGTEVPPDQTARLVRERNARGVAVSVSSMSRGEASMRRLAELRRLLPRRSLMLLGGDGAEEMPGTILVRDLQQLEQWARETARLAGAGPSD